MANGCPLTSIRNSPFASGARNPMHDDHDHGHHEGHQHRGHHHAPPQKDHDAGPASAYEVLEEAVRTLLIDKGVLTAQEIAESVDLMDSRSPALGAKVVAR